MQRTGDKDVLGGLAARYISSMNDSRNLDGKYTLHVVDIRVGNQEIAFDVDVSD